MSIPFSYFGAELRIRALIDKHGYDQKGARLFKGPDELVEFLMNRLGPTFNFLGLPREIQLEIAERLDYDDLKMLE